jgi:hypothetical protein
MAKSKPSVESLAPVIKKPARRSADEVAADRAAREAGPPTLAERVAHDLEVSGGTMPICILVKTKDEFDEATAIVKKVKGAVVTVQLAPDEVCY